MGKKFFSSWFLCRTTCWYSMLKTLMEWRPQKWLMPRYICSIFYATYSCSYYQYFYMKNRGAYTAYIILSTLQQTCVQAREFRLYVTWVRVAEMSSNRKLNKCIHGGFYKMAFKKIRYTYHGDAMKYTKMVHGILAKYHILELPSSYTKVNQGLNLSLTDSQVPSLTHSSTPQTLYFWSKSLKGCLTAEPKALKITTCSYWSFRGIYQGMSITVHPAKPTGSLTGSFNLSDIISTLVDGGDCVCSLRMKKCAFSSQ